jgi:hypothetical protein
MKLVHLGSSAMNANALRWDGAPGHYEVHYVSLTDRGSGTGVWIRSTMLAPLQGEPTCALWFMAMTADGERVGRKLTLPIGALAAEADPFHLRVGESELTDRGMAGGFEDVRWELRWEPSLSAAEHVHPLLRRARIAKTILTLPHPDLAVHGTVAFGGREIELAGARGGQAHLWGSKHASRWTWLHCNDLASLEDEPRPDSYVDGVSVFVPRAGRQVGPSTPVVGRFLGEDFRSTSPLRVVRNRSSFALSSWRFEAREGARRVVGEVDAPRESLVGVTYHDPDGERAWCYNSEVASLRLSVWDRTSRGRFGWILRDTLAAPGRAHFEYAQRDPVSDVPVLLT